MTTTAPHPRDETARLTAIRRYDILDTPPDGAFDRITALAARLCDVPISTITIVDQDRIWFKSAFGIDVEEIGRDPGLCASAIFRDVPHVVTDAIEDPRTLNNPLVRGALGLRFYVGIPLTTEDGHRLGTLNVIDLEPREPSDEEIRNLEDLAAIVVDELELRLSARRTIELEAAKEAAEVRSSLLAGISHEMRTRISVLSGLAELDPVDADEDEEMRAMMRRNVRQLDWLVHQYLDFITIEAGRTPPIDPERVAITPLVDDAVEVFAADAPIEVRYEDDVPDGFVDPDRTRRVLVELLNNAIRFGPNGARVDVDVSRTDDGDISVAVTDRGPGISSDDPERVFDKLFRGSDSSGSGIGLFVARALMEAQGGRVEVPSTSRTGSRFTLTLPAFSA